MDKIKFKYINFFKYSQFMLHSVRCWAVVFLMSPLAIFMFGCGAKLEPFGMDDSDTARMTDDTNTDTATHDTGIDTATHDTGIETATHDTNTETATHDTDTDTATHDTDTENDFESSDSSTEVLWFEAILGTPVTNTPDMLELCSRPELTYYEAEKLADGSWQYEIVFDPIKETIDGYWNPDRLEPCEPEENCIEKATYTSDDGIQVMVLKGSGDGIVVELSTDEAVFGWSYIHYNRNFSSGDGEDLYHWSQSFLVVEWLGKPFSHLPPDSQVARFSDVDVTATVIYNYHFESDGCEISVASADGDWILKHHDNTWEQYTGNYYTLPTLSLNEECFAVAPDGKYWSGWIATDDCEYSPADVPFVIRW